MNCNEWIDKFQKEFRKLKGDDEYYGFFRSELLNFKMDGMTPAPTPIPEEPVKEEKKKKKKKKADVNQDPGWAKPQDVYDEPNNFYKTEEQMLKPKSGKLFIKP